MDKKYLPYGSVVKIKGSARNLMVIGLKKMSDNHKVYDYIAIALPEGFEGYEKMILFNRDAISEVVKEGYEDELTKDFYDDIVWLENRGEKFGE